MTTQEPTRHQVLVPLDSAAKTPLPLTTTIVNSKIPKNSIKNPILSSGLQNSSQLIDGSPDSLNILSRASSIAGKQVYPRGRFQTCCIARHSSRNPSSEALFSSFLDESKEESLGSNPKTPTAPRVVIGKLSKRVPPLKLSTTFSEGKTFTMS